MESGQVREFRTRLALEVLSAENRPMRRGLILVALAVALASGCGAEEEPAPEASSGLLGALAGLILEERYLVQAAFPADQQLEAGADVRIGGISVGAVDRVEPAGRMKLATLAIEAEFEPIAPDVQAVLRQKTLLGESYVELTSGDVAPLIDPNVEGGTTVRELFKSFDPETRRAFQEWQREAKALSP